MSVISGDRGIARKAGVATSLANAHMRSSPRPTFIPVLALEQRERLTLRQVSARKTAFTPSVHSCHC